MRVLGIETSCDETAAAVVEDGLKILSNVVATQDEIHAAFGGVVPELASRRHLELVLPVIESALKKSGLTLKDMDGIAVTAGPGLVVCLLVGISVAKAVAFAERLPIIGVNHLEGHLMAIFAEEKPVSFPFVGLLVSGGHTSLYYVEGWSNVRTLGYTLDDAAGEAFDKVARVLGLPYPGGKELEQLSRRGNRQAIAFPRSMLGEDHYNFSFSGLKTAVIKYVEKCRDVDAQRADIAASFQEAVAEVLVKKAVAAGLACGVKELVLCGGVAANGRIRELLQSEAGAKGLKASFPSLSLCTDNAAMIAGCGNFYLTRGDRSNSDLNARSSWPL